MGKPTPDDLKKIRVLTRILCKSEHGKMWRRPMCCGKCVHFRPEPVEHVSASWWGRCGMRAMKCCPKEQIPYSRDICPYYEEREGALECWEVETR